MKCDVLEVLNVKEDSHLAILEMGLADLKSGDKLTVKKEVCGRMLEQYKGNLKRVEESVEKDKLKNDWWEVERGAMVKPEDKKKDAKPDPKVDSKDVKKPDIPMDKKADNRSLGSDRGKSVVKGK